MTLFDYNKMFSGWNASLETPFRLTVVIASRSEVKGEAIQHAAGAAWIASAASPPRNDDDEAKAPQHEAIHLDSFAVVAI